MSGPSTLSDHFSRLSALLDFLEDYYRLARPPVRSIAEYREFLLREPQLPRVPGIKLGPGANVWLEASLPEHAPIPAVPQDLSPWVTQAALTPIDRPVVPLTDSSSENDLELAIEVDEWAREVWEPWAAEWRQIETARIFYKQLYAVRAQLDRNRDSLELLWGFGRLRWQTPKGLIDHPLITVPVEFALGEDGQIAVSPAGAPEIEYACLAEIQLADRPGYQAMRQAGAADEMELWDPQARTVLFHRLLRLLDHDGKLVANQPDSPASSVRLSDEWALFLRPRQTNYLGFLDQLRQVYRHGSVPTLPFLSLVADTPSSLADPLDSPGDQGDRPSSEDHTLYLPKPANEEQHRILRLAQRRAGVTAQGPPGTGKSHTIANLICHFVAQGKRVLVTAEKEQALTVLAGKLPSAVRQLTVAVLGSDEASRTRLEQAVNAIQTQVGHYDEHAVLSEISRLRKRIDDIDAAIAGATHRLRASRALEVTSLKGTYEAGTDPTPSIVAAWLREHRSELSFIDDEIALSAALPLKPAEWDEFVRLVRDLDPADIAHCGVDRPPPERLPNAAYLNSMRHELMELRDQLSDVEPSLEDWVGADSATLEQLQGLASALSEAADWWHAAVGTWLDTIRAECVDPLTRTEWVRFLDDVEAARESAVTYRGVTLAFDLHVPDPRVNGLIGGLRQARDRYALGKGVSRIFQHAAAQALDKCLVDGRRPSTVEDVDACLAALGRIEQQRRLRQLWANGVGRVNGPPLDERRSPEDAVTEYLGQLKYAIDWTINRWPSIVQNLRELHIRVPDNISLDEITWLNSTIRTLMLRPRERELTASFNELEEFLRAGVTSGKSPLWGELADALDRHHWQRWESARREVCRLADMQDRVARCTELRASLYRVAPRFTTRLSESRAEAAVNYDLLKRAWEWRQLETWLATVISQESPAKIQHELEALAQERLSVMENLVAAQAWQGLVASFDDRKRGALNRYLTATKRFGKTGGKYAARWLREIREALDESKEAVPVWIMPTNRVLSSFLPESPPPFDVLVVDEASQIGLLGLPILALAHKAIVVGDDQQTSPENVGLDRQSVFDLIDGHFDGLRYAQSVFDADNSLYDVARQKFPEVVVLREHFRSLPAIISFSNNRYYGGDLVPLRDRPPAPGWQPVRTVFVPDGFRDGRDINEPEAAAVVELIAELCTNPSYNGMTIGVVSLLGRAQSLRIQELLLDRLGPEVLEERGIRCGEPPDFQGDERDVIVISTVVNRSTERRIGAMTDRRSERRINVAASRARNQLWIVHSAAPEDFPRGDPRAELIRYCQNPMAVETIYTNLESRCESQFERAVLRRILDRGYRHVRTQHEVGRYRIDIVVEGPESRLAVECDGDAWHGPEHWENDRNRQQILERAGWTFERIRASAFYRDPEAALESLWSRLEELGIPVGDWNEDADPTFSHRVGPIVVQGQEHIAANTAASPSLPKLDLDDDAASHDLEHAQFSDTISDASADGTTIRATEKKQVSDLMPATIGTAAEVPEQPSTRGLTSARPTLATYVTWTPRPLSPILAGDSKRVGEELIEIVNAEGPIQALRLYQIHARAAGGRRVGREMRRAYNKLLSRLVRAGLLALIDDDLQGLVEKTVYIPGGQPVLVRELGPRELTEVPRSEIQALIRALGLAGASPQAVRVEVLRSLGRLKLTHKAASYLTECIRYRCELPPGRG